MQTFKFVRRDDGFVRTYYRGSEDRQLYCLQACSHGSEWPARYEFMPCTRDGEPEYGLAYTPIKSRFDRFELVPYGRKPTA